jgi:hypothetical protein
MTDDKDWNDLKRERGTEGTRKIVDEAMMAAQSREQAGNGTQRDDAEQRRKFEQERDKDFPPDDDDEAGGNKSGNQQGGSGAVGRALDWGRALQVRRRRQRRRRRSCPTSGSLAGTCSPSLKRPREQFWRQRRRAYSSALGCWSGSNGSRKRKPSRASRATPGR